MGHHDARFDAHDVTDDHRDALGGQDGVVALCEAHTDALAHHLDHFSAMLHVAAYREHAGEPCRL